jgi:acyl-CoA thioester hydrolase
MDGFQFVHDIGVRLRDLDARGHLNNAVVATFLEDARYAWYRASGASDEPAPLDYTTDMVLARTEIDYRGELRESGVTVSVGVRVSRIGNKSAELEYRVCAGDHLIADAKSVLVGFDFDARRSAPIPERWMRRLSSGRQAADMQPPRG